MLGHANLFIIFNFEYIKEMNKLSNREIFSNNEIKIKSNKLYINKEQFKLVGI